MHGTGYKNMLAPYLKPSFNNLYLYGSVVLEFSTNPYHRIFRTSINTKGIVKSRINGHILIGV